MNNRKPYFVYHIKRIWLVEHKKIHENAKKPRFGKTQQLIFIKTLFCFGDANTVGDTWHKYYGTPGDPFNFFLPFLLPELIINHNHQARGAKAYKKKVPKININGFFKYPDCGKINILTLRSCMLNAYKSCPPHPLFWFDGSMWFQNAIVRSNWIIFMCILFHFIHGKWILFLWHLNWRICPEENWKLSEFSISNEKF
jgi:hypothetical protein